AFETPTARTAWPNGRAVGWPGPAFSAAYDWKRSGPSLPGAISPCPVGDSNKSSIARSRSCVSEELVQRIDADSVTLGEDLQRFPALQSAIIGQLTKFCRQSGWVRRLVRPLGDVPGRNQHRKLTKRPGESLHQLMNWLNNQFIVHFCQLTPDPDRRIRAQDSLKFCQ